MIYMLKLIIADDEEIIRQTIGNMMDWESLGIQLVATCKNGIEAYDAVLDENPDIVLTDIKMPGLTGLQLIQHIRQVNENIEFIILSGYGEFGFAAEAMKYGIRHYLLKPCDEGQIIDVIKSVCHECYQKRALRNYQEERKSLTSCLKENILCNIVAECTSEHFDFEALVKTYERFIDFTSANYELCYIHFLEEPQLAVCLEDLNAYFKEHLQLDTNYIYVKNTLILFFESISDAYDGLDTFMKSMTFANQNVEITYKRVSYKNLYFLLQNLLGKLKLYSMIYFINDGYMVPICNYDTLLKKAEECSNRLRVGDGESFGQTLLELKSVLFSVNNTEFLKALIASLLLKHSNSMYDTMAELLLEMRNMDDPAKICDHFFAKIQILYHGQSTFSPKYKAFIEKALLYIDENLSDPKLSLKEIAEKQLFMNVDYLSKQFLKQTGYKFSTYVNKKRIQKAKLLLLNCGEDKIHSVAIAEEIGCGNNPQYFSQLFKKYVGMTPTAYIRSLRSK